MREITVENYLKTEVETIGGEVRKMKWVNRNHAPDRIVFFKGAHFIELKKPGERPRPGQTREHNRMRKQGVAVWVIDTKKGVDAFIQFLKSL